MKLASTILVFCVAALLALGIIMLYSSRVADAGARFLVPQLIWCVLGFVGFALAAAVDYRLLKKYSWALFLGASVLLVLVLIPKIGIKVNGATRWLGYRSFRLQPSELAKLAIIVVLAHYGDHFQRQMGTFWRGLFFPALFVGLVFGLIFVEQDRGTSMLIAGVSALLLIVAGTKVRYIVAPAMCGLALLTYSFINDPMRSERIYSWLHLEETRTGKGMQAYEAMLALGSGGTTGLGLGNGRQKLGFVPERHTDFIFAIIGEELGLVATGTVVLLFTGFAAAGLTIASRSRDVFGQLLASGITVMIVVQAFINMGVVTSLLPNKGMPLPFISYGGSNLLAMLVMTGFLVSVARHNPERETESKSLNVDLPDSPH